MRLLLVDDDEFDRLLFSHRVRDVHPDWVVREAVDVRTACETLEAEAFDIVVTDLMLPDADGPDVVRAIRERCDAPIVVLSGLREADGPALREAGASVIGGKDDFDVAVLQRLA